MQQHKPDPMLEALYCEHSVLTVAALPVHEPGCYGTVQLYCNSAYYPSSDSTIAKRGAESFALFVEDEVFTDEL